MRFLLGLITGALFTILAASVINVPTEVIAEDLREAWNELVQKVQRSAQSERPEAVVVARADRNDEVLPDAFPPTPFVSPADNLAEQISGERFPQEENLPQADPGTRVIAETSAAHVVEPDQNPEPSTEPAAAQPVAQLNQIATSQTSSPTQSSKTIWEPFHSEVSATGFAKRLSLQLGYPFQVTKDGPARYLVVFKYKSDEERALLVQQIATLTGYRVP